MDIVEKMKKLDKLEEQKKRLRQTQKRIKTAEAGMAIGRDMMLISYGWLLGYLMWL